MKSTLQGGRDTRNSDFGNPTLGREEETITCALGSLIVELTLGGGGWSLEGVGKKALVGWGPEREVLTPLAQRDRLK